MIKISKIIFVLLFFLPSIVPNVTRADIEKYLERTSKVENKNQDWIFEFKNKDKQNYLLTIFNNGRVIVDEMSVLSAKGSKDSDFSYIRINSASGFKPSVGPTFIILRNKKNTSAKAWQVESSKQIFISYEKEVLVPQRDSFINKLFSKTTTSGLLIKDNVKDKAIKQVDPDYVIALIKKSERVR